MEFSYLFIIMKAALHCAVLRCAVLCLSVAVYLFACPISCVLLIQTPWCTSFYILLHVISVLHSVTFSPPLLFSCIASLHSSSNRSFLEVLERIPKPSCLSFLALFPLQLYTHPVLFHLNLVNYSLSFFFQSKNKVQL